MQRIKSSLLCPSTIFNCTKTITDVKSSQEITNWYYITAAMQRVRLSFALSSLRRCQFDTTVLPLVVAIQLCFISAVPISPTLLNMTPTHLLTLSMSPWVYRVHPWNLPPPKTVRFADFCQMPGNLQNLDMQHFSLSLVCTKLLC